MLTMHTPEGGSLSESNLANRVAAGVARLAGAAVDIQFAEEVTGFAVGADEVAQGSATALNRPAEDAFDLVGETAIASARNGAGGTTWIDTGSE